MESTTKVFTNLTDALDLKPGEVISLVGGGGKTTLMFALAAELVASGKKVITTTTTKIMEPTESQTPLFIVEKDEQEIIQAVNHSIDEKRHITIGSEKLPTGQLKGITPQLIERLDKLNKVFCIINEADGAAGKPLKAPNATEPVIPVNTTLVIPVTGADAIGIELAPENVFRPEIVSSLLNIRAGEILTPELIAALITHPLGIIKGTPRKARIIPFINKADLDRNNIKSLELAKQILKTGHPQISGVIAGQADKEDSLLTGIFRS
jgi:probable selenium-dependent hydroxylase accessory protein YqeC